VTIMILRELSDKKRARYRALGSLETIEDSVLLGHDVASMYNPTPTFRGSVVSSHSRVDNLENKDTALLQKSGIRLPIDMASYPKRTETSNKPLRNPHNSQDTVLWGPHNLSV
jgi:hypothetical protein